MVLAAAFLSLLPAADTVPLPLRPLYLVAEHRFMNAPKPVEPQPAKMLSANYYLLHLAPSCVAEKQLQKALKLPLYIRLGNLETVNRLEGKY